MKEFILVTKTSIDGDLDAVEIVEGPLSREEIKKIKENVTYCKGIILERPNEEHAYDSDLGTTPNTYLNKYNSKWSPIYIIPIFTLDNIPL